MKTLVQTPVCDSEAERMSRSWMFRCERCLRYALPLDAFLDAQERLICRDCYLADPPQMDIALAVAEVAVQMGEEL